MDHKAFYSAFNHSANLLQSSARNFTGNMEDAIALYQETAFQIAKQKEAVNEVSRFKEWALGMMRNIFLTSLQKKKHALSQDASGIREVRLENMLSKVDELEESLRVPFWNHFMGLSDQEIADYTGLSVETVRDRVITARQQLKNFSN